jgi:hypothetical protein
MCVGLSLSFWCGAPGAVAADDDWQEIYDGAKADFTKKFEQFKKDGLSAEQTKELCELLKKAGGKNIEGTGTEVLLNALHQQAKNASSIMEKKEKLEKLIEFVGDVYALSISDTPPDGVEAYEALAKGMPLLAELADEIPVINKVAVPMIEAYGQAIENGLPHIKAIAKATDRKNELIAVGWRSWPPPDELYWMTEMEEEEEVALTEEEIIGEAILAEERERNAACARECEAEYVVYDKAIEVRGRAWRLAQTAWAELKEAKEEVNRHRHNYSDARPRYNNYRANFKRTLDDYKVDQERVERLKKEGATEAARVAEELLASKKERLVGWVETLRTDYRLLSLKREKYAQAMTDVLEARENYETLLTEYKASDEESRRAYEVYNDCITRCLESAESNGAGGLWDGDNWGDIFFYTRPKADGLIATYTEDNGRVYGTLEGRRLVGIWVEDAAAEKCDDLSPTPDPRRYWGHVVVQFNEEFTEFVGEWGYCDGATDREWVGKRR